MDLRKTQLYLREEKALSTLDLLRNVRTERRVRTQGDHRTVGGGTIVIDAGGSARLCGPACEWLFVLSAAEVRRRKGGPALPLQLSAVECRSALGDMAERY